MDKKQIIRTESGQKIQLGSYLGSGQIAAVYKGTIEGEDRTVAVKIPAENFDSIAREYDLLKQLATKSKTIPEAELGKDANGRDLLIMEYIGDEWLLGGRLFEIKDDLLKREEIVLNAALQYANLLEVLHSISYTCPDRKTTDLRWLKVDQEYPLQGRLVVLDWNAVTKNSTDFAGDIVLFGENWYQLITGKMPRRPVSPLNETN